MRDVFLEDIFFVLLTKTFPLNQLSILKSPLFLQYMTLSKT